MARGLVIHWVAEHGLGACANLSHKGCDARIARQFEGGPLSQHFCGPTTFGDQFILIVADLHEACGQRFAAFERVLSLVANKRAPEFLDQGRCVLRRIHPFLMPLDTRVDFAG